MGSALHSSLNRSARRDCCSNALSPPKSDWHRPTAAYSRRDRDPAASRTTSRACSAAVDHMPSSMARDIRVTAAAAPRCVPRALTRASYSSVRLDGGMWTSRMADFPPSARILTLTSTGSLWLWSFDRNASSPGSANSPVAIDAVARKSAAAPSARSTNTAIFPDGITGQRILKPAAAMLSPHVGASRLKSPPHPDAARDPPALVTRANFAARSDDVAGRTGGGGGLSRLRLAHCPVCASRMASRSVTFDRGFTRYRSAHACRSASRQRTSPCGKIGSYGPVSRRGFSVPILYPNGRSPARRASSSRPARTGAPAVPPRSTPITRTGS